MCQVQSSGDNTILPVLAESSDEQKSANNIGEKIKRRDSDNDENEPVKKRGRLEEGVDSTEGIIETEGVESSAEAQCKDTDPDSSDVPQDHSSGVNI